MRKLWLAFGLVTITIFPVSGQSIDKELADLRRFLNVPSSTPIGQSTEPFTGSSPIRVFIAAGNEADYRLFIKTIDKWNQKDGQTFRTISVVSDLESADVILVRNRKIGKEPLSGTQPLYPLESYSYIIRRKSDHLEILWRNVLVNVYIDVSRKSESPSVLTEFFKRLKKTRSK